MNKIETVRKETLEMMQKAPEGIGEKESSLSLSGNYRLEETIYCWHPDDYSIYRVSRAEIFDNNSNELLFSFLANESPFYYSWATKNDVEYFLCAEDLCGGQTVIDLTNRKMVSYTENDDGFIWTNHVLSPDETMLAVFGCCWATAYFCIIYDFTNPMDLPLKIIKQTDAIGYDFLGWVDNKHLKVTDGQDKEPYIIEI